LINFFHVSEYIGKLAQAHWPKRSSEDKRAAWQHAQCRRLKQDRSVSDKLVADAAKLSRRASLSQAMREQAFSAWIDFDHHRYQMDYPSFVAEGLPIGSGVTEAACKSLVKQRLCASGVRWKHTAAKIVLSLRVLTDTAGRWTQFWQSLEQFGAECLA